MSSKWFPLFSVHEPRIRILHFTWLAFFITFLIWFAHVSLMPMIRVSMHLTDAQVKAFLILNVALTIPARILIGILVDRYGPRVSYSVLLAISGALCIGFAAAQTFEQLAVMRFLLGFTGAGFVIGIRLVSEWFPAREVGIAEGIYGGWGTCCASWGSGLNLASKSKLSASLSAWRRERPCRTAAAGRSCSGGRAPARHSAAHNCHAVREQMQAPLRQRSTAAISCR